MEQGEGVSALFPLFGLLIVGAVLLILLILLFALVAWVVRGKGGVARPAAAPYKVRSTVMTQPEQVLYGRLIEALPNKLIFTQVQFSRILEVRNVPNRISWLNKIIRLSADFVVCHPDSSVMAVIELDDASHTAAQCRDADMRKDHACAAAGVRIIRWHVNEIPSVETIR